MFKFLTVAASIATIVGVIIALFQLLWEDELPPAVAAVLPVEVNGIPREILSLSKEYRDEDGNAVNYVLFSVSSVAAWKLGSDVEFVDINPENELDERKYPDDAFASDIIRSNGVQSRLRKADHVISIGLSSNYSGSLETFPLKQQHDLAVARGDHLARILFLNPSDVANGKIHLTRYWSCSIGYNDTIVTKQVSKLERDQRAVIFLVLFGEMTHDQIVSLLRSELPKYEQELHISPTDYDQFRDGFQCKQRH